MDRSPVLSSLGSQAGVVDINHTFHLYNKCCMWVEFQSISTWLRGFSPGTPVSTLLKMDSQSNPSGCGAVLRGHTWVVFRDRAPSWQHSSFDPTSLSCALWNSVFDCEKGRLAGQTFTVTFTYSNKIDKTEMNLQKTGNRKGGRRVAHENVCDHIIGCCLFWKAKRIN